jgi:hypothetical protein
MRRSCDIEIFIPAAPRWHEDMPHATAREAHRWRVTQMPVLVPKAVGYMCSVVVIVVMTPRPTKGVSAEVLIDLPSPAPTRSYQLPSAMATHAKRTESRKDLSCKCKLESYG